MIDAVKNTRTGVEIVAKKLGKSTKNEGKTLIGYKYCVDPSYDAAFDMLRQNLGASRWMYNQYVADYKAALDDGKPPVIRTPAKYKQNPDVPWLKKMDSLNLANVQINFSNAIQRFHDGLSGFPRFKSKRDYHDSYTTNMVNGNIKLDVINGEAYLTLPKIGKPLKLIYHRSIPENGEIKSVTVSHTPDDKFYVSILVAIDKKVAVHKIDPQNAIGLDMSLPKLYVDSNGHSADFEKTYRENEKRLAREQKKLSKMVRGSNNYKKQKQKIAAIHAKIANQRKDSLHKISTALTNKYDIIGIEDLDMGTMKKSLKFGKSVSDNGWGIFTRMLEYKAENKGKMLIRVDKWFPSSKTCCQCGYIHKELKLSEREYICPACGHVMERDHQAGINIRDEAVRLFFTLDPASA